MSCARENGIYMYRILIQKIYAYKNLISLKHYATLLYAVCANLSHGPLTLKWQLSWIINFYVEINDP